jgi:hypothetical protein
MASYSRGRLSLRSPHWELLKSHIRLSHEKVGTGKFARLHGVTFHEIIIFRDRCENLGHHSWRCLIFSTKMEAVCCSENVITPIGLYVASQNIALRYTDPLLGNDRGISIRHPLLSNGTGTNPFVRQLETAIEEWCFLCGPSRYVRSKTGTVSSR